MGEDEKSSALYAMATNLRHAAAETVWPDYRQKLLEAARDLESEADRRDHDRPPPASRTG